jgi:hypothetical protein
MEKLDLNRVIILWNSLSKWELKPRNISDETLKKAIIILETKQSWDKNMINIYESAFELNNR